MEKDVSFSSCFPQLSQLLLTPVELRVRGKDGSKEVS